ncbi:hypothetical protein [Garciella nitratireducens]|uniref:hypothetical protein n=1 Tax=Garciella nitratireducens TaxID=218205 RepID=UPI000E0729AD|nr:hypothetical protein [Garciella nitratireducens]RBP46927.1 hypothetical protein DFR81_101338 [Garciella nitratireducens]
MNEMLDLFAAASIFIPVMVGLAKIAQMVMLPKKWTPIWNLAIGLVIAVVYVYPEDIKTSIMVGIMLGLSASGLYSGVKNTTQAIRSNKK